jgi:16S rRNA (uracil1498-N3)-methyltransferase
MSSERFFVEAFSPEEKTIYLKGEEVHHLRNVLRKSAHDQIEVFNGKGASAICKIDKVSRSLAVAKIISQNLNPITKDYRLSLNCAIPKRQKMGLIIQKLTELGADEIVPMFCQRSSFRPNSQERKKLLKRWKKISIEACKQCGRNTLPEIKPISSFDKLCASLDRNSLNLLACLNPQSLPLKALASEFGKCNSIVAFIGPEGDFTPQEIYRARQKGCRLISLGSTTLRVETAAVLLAGIVNYEKQI